MWKWIHQFGSPKYFYEFSWCVSFWAGWIALVAIAVGLVGGLVLAPADYQQGDSFRIIYVHVPSAWLSLSIYTMMAVCGAITLIWRIKVTEIIASGAAPLGATFTFLALATGSLWGKPMWGAYWVWDARLTSELILLFLYLGYMAIASAFEDRRTGARAAAILALVGVVNIPIIHYSVEWWNTLHQGPTVTKFDSPSIHMSMLIPLLISWIGFSAYFVHVLMIRTRTGILIYESNTSWVKALLTEPNPEQK